MTYDTKIYANTIKQPNSVASAAQIAYLDGDKGLLKTREFTVKTGFPNLPAIRFAIKTNHLTKGQAGLAISTLLTQPYITKTVVSEDGISAASTASTNTSAPAPEFGYYLVANSLGKEVLYSWNQHKSGHMTKTKLMKLTTYTAYDKDGNKVPKGKWTYFGSSYQAKKLLSGVKKLTVEEAGKLGKQYGICIKCGRTLTDPESVAQGIGPKCAKYQGWA